MPNWTSNILNVVGKPEAVDKFVAHMGEVMDFEKVIPPPENMFRDNLSSEDKERLAADGIPNWYDWQSANWGTKWNASSNEGSVELEKYESMNMKQATYRFETAWDTPREVITALWDKWPDLDFEGGYIHEVMRVAVRFRNSTIGNDGETLSGIGRPSGRPFLLPSRRVGSGRELTRSRARRPALGPGDSRARTRFKPGSSLAAGTKKGRPEGLPDLLGNDGLGGDLNRWIVAVGLDEFWRGEGQPHPKDFGLVHIAIFPRSICRIRFSDCVPRGIFVFVFGKLVGFQNPDLPMSEVRMVRLKRRIWVFDFAAFA